MSMWSSTYSANRQVVMVSPIALSRKSVSWISLSLLSLSPMSLSLMSHSLRRARMAQ
jgi:hypothetical protein